MSSFRLLLWLRWRLAMNLTTGRRRWVVIALATLMAFAFAPFYMGAAWLSYVGTARDGASTLLLVFAGAQASIIWVSLLAGALGRTFELDKLKRYPFRTFDVFLFNVLASLAEPIALITLPSLIAAVFGMAHHDGWVAGLTAAGSGLVMLLITASLLQMLLAILDDFLRREWMRYVAGLLFTATFLSINLTIGRSSRRLAEQAAKLGLTPERILEDMRALCAQIPTVAAPASLAGAPVPGPLGSPFVAFAACAALLALPLWLGSRIMGRAVLRETLAGRVKSRGVRASAGSFALRWPGLTPAQALLIAREWLYIVRSPAVLYQMVITPLVIIFLVVFGRAREGGSSYFQFVWIFMLSTGLASRNLALWAFDGTGLRSLFLMPFSARDLVFSKNVAWLASAMLHVTVTLGALVATRHMRALSEVPLIFAGYLAAAFPAASIGTWVSIAHPMKPQGRGFTRQSPGGLPGFLAYLGVLALVSLIVLAVAATRALSPDAYDLPASWVVMLVLLAVAVGIWWISLDRNADALVLRRENMIDVLAKGTDT